MAFTINKELKLKLIAILMLSIGFGILCYVGMNLFTNGLNSVMGMSTSMTGDSMPVLPDENTFIMSFIDQTSLIEGIIGVIISIIGVIAYIWYPLINFKNQAKDTLNQFTGKTNEEPKNDDLGGWKYQPLPKDAIVINAKPRYRPRRIKKNPNYQG
jgi:hypothetical protein